MYLNNPKYTGSVKAIALYKSYHATSVLYRIIVYIVNTYIYIYSKIIFTITAEIFARSLASFYCQ